MLLFFVILLILIAIGLVFGQFFLDIPGRVIIALPDTVIEMTPLSSLIILTSILLALVLLIALIKRVTKTAGFSHRWLKNRNQKLQQKSFYTAINMSLIDELDTAEQEISKTYKANFTGTNALLGASIAIQNNKLEDAKSILKLALETPETAQIAKLKLAQIALIERQFSVAMDLIASIDGSLRSTQAFIDCKMRILVALEDWSEIVKFAGQHKKQLSEEHLALLSNGVKNEFAAISSKQGAKSLISHWQTLPKKQQNDLGNVIEYISLIIEQGLHKDAEHVLVSAAKKHGFDKLLPLFKRLILRSPTLAISFLEAQLKKQGDNPSLLSALAHVAYNSGDLILAKKVIDKSLSLDKNTDDLKLLANILEAQNDHKGANQIYTSLL